MTCPVCGEPAPFGVVCCDLLIAELDDDNEIRGSD